MKSAFIWIGITVVLVGGVFLLVKMAKPDLSLTLPNEVSVDDWVKGNRESKVILVEYGDFQCPACGAYYPLVEKLLTDYGTKMQFVYRHFPLSQHANAVPAARASEAAGKQGKFWEMYGLIFARQNDWTNRNDGREVFEGYASSLGLNMDQYKSDRDSQATEDEIDRDRKGGYNARVNSTPTFFLNGKQIQPKGYDEFKSLIEDEIQQNP